MNKPGARFNYRDKLQAAKGVLVEACLTLTGLEYAVMGGWPHYLRSAGNRLGHPGTFDLDLLFRPGPQPIGTAAERLIAAGYLPSAKTHYVLFKMLLVEGKAFVFNIDLLLLLPRRTRAVFDEKLWSPFEVEAILPTGESRRCTIPLLDETGSILIKSEVLRKDERRRDAFDIFFSLTGPSGPEVARRLKDLGNRLPLVAAQLEILNTFLREHPETFNKDVWRYSGSADAPDPAGQVSAALSAI